MSLSDASFQLSEAVVVVSQVEPGKYEVLGAGDVFSFFEQEKRHNSNRV